MIKARYAGQPRGSGRSGGTVSGETRTKKADEFAIGVAPFLAQAREAGCQSFPQAANHFNKLGIRSAEGGTWSRVQVGHLVQRLKALGEL